MYSLLRFVPKNHLSFLVGKLVQVPLPPMLNRKLLSWFAGRYNVVVDEADRPIDGYASLGEFFTRDLKAGARQIDAGVVSPVDGRIVEFGEIDEGALLQAKGKRYRVERAATR